MQPKKAPQAVRLPSWVNWLLFAALGLFCYAPALSGTILWDDQAHITRADLRSWGGLWDIWFKLGATQQYYPVLHSAFWFEHHLWGDAPLGYHLVNVLLHSAAAALLVIVLRRLAIPGATLAGFLFLVHPICVESVAWISEQKNTLSLVFYLLSAYFYLDFDKTRAPRPIGRYCAALGLFLLAIGTKTVTATLPAALLVVVWWKRGNLSWRRDVLPLLPWFAAALCGGLTTAWVERKMIGAEGAGFDLSLIERCLLAGRVIWFYLGKLVWPADLSFVYVHWNVHAQASGWIFFLGLALAATALLWLLRKRSRAPLAAWLFFVGSLAPALGFFNVYPFLFSYVADHFQYLASIGIVTLAAAGAAILIGRSPASLRPTGWGLCAVLIGLLAFLTRAQSATYRSGESLYTSTLSENPSAWMPEYNLGILLAQDGRPAEAISHYEKAVALKPDYFEAFANWGTALLAEGDVPGAIQKYQRSLALNPNGIEARTSLAEALARMGDLDSAIAQSTQVLRLDPGFAPAHFNLANYYRKERRIPEAISEYESALKSNPNYADAALNLGGILLESGRLDEAVSWLQDATRIDPNQVGAHRNLALALHRLGREAEAREESATAASLSEQH